jgi:hypothetical protein
MSLAEWNTAQPAAGRPRCHQPRRDATGAVAIRTSLQHSCQHVAADCVKSRYRGQNDRVGIGEELGAVNAELGGPWQLERRLGGGWYEGAYLLTGGRGSRAVLKWRASDPERLLGARERVGRPAPGLARPEVAGRRPGIVGRGVGGAGVH